MKTEQEQIKVIKQIIDERVETTLGQVQGRHDNVIKTVDTVIIARDIVNAGYGDVSEYKAEIERLKAENEYRKKQYDNQLAENTRLHIEYDKAFERLKAQQREIDQLKAKNEQLEEDIDMVIKEQKSDYKFDIIQAKIDVLNELRNKCHNYYPSIDHYCCSVKAVNLSDINKMIEELDK